MDNKIKRHFKLSSDKNIKMTAIYDDESKSRKIKGYAALFDHKSRLTIERRNNEKRLVNLIIGKNAFDEVLQDENLDVVFNLNHDLDQVFARTKSGTLKVYTDDKGLVFEADLPDTERGREVYEMVNRGDWYECSFAAYLLQENERWERDDETKVWNNYVDKFIMLQDVCVATYHGKFSNTDVQVMMNTIDELEKSENTDLNTDSGEIDREKLDLDIFLIENERV